MNCQDIILSKHNSDIYLHICPNALASIAGGGTCATKRLDTFLGFRGGVITTTYGLPADFAIAPADTDDREVLPFKREYHTYLCTILIIIGISPLNHVKLLRKQLTKKDVKSVRAILKLIGMNM